MQLSFILSGQRIEVKSRYMHASIGLVDVTPVGELWARWMPTGQEKLEIEGTTADGKEFKGIFRVVSRSEDGVMEITPWTDVPSVGTGE